jgi:hypothetical protein
VRRCVVAQLRNCQGGVSLECHTWSLIACGVAILRDKEVVF